MDRDEVRQIVIDKIADELFLEHSYVEQVLTQLEKENEDLLYGHDTITELVARILGSLDFRNDNW